MLVLIPTNVAGVLIRLLGLLFTKNIHNDPSNFKLVCPNVCNLFNFLCYLTQRLVAVVVVYKIYIYWMGGFTFYKLFTTTKKEKNK